MIRFQADADIDYDIVLAVRRRERAVDFASAADSGMAGLGDLGRVFVAGESSSRWHSGVGGGLWLALFATAPGAQIATSFNALVVRSDERTSFYFAGGFGF